MVTFFFKIPCWLHCINCCHSFLLFSHMFIIFNLQNIWEVFQLPYLNTKKNFYKNLALFFDIETPVFVLRSWRWNFECFGIACKVWWNWWKIPKWGLRFHGIPIGNKNKRRDKVMSEGLKADSSVRSLSRLLCCVTTDNNIWFFLLAMLCFFVPTRARQ